MRSPLTNLFASTSVILLSLTSALAPAFASERFTPAHPYPKNVVAMFMEGCSASQPNADPKIMEQICYCAIQAMQDKYTLDEMFGFSREMMAHRTLPYGVQEISVGCATAVFKANSRQ